VQKARLRVIFAHASYLPHLFSKVCIRTNRNQFISFCCFSIGSFCTSISWAADIVKLRIFQLKAYLASGSVPVYNHGHSCPRRLEI
jgi:hypothetical protein